jgi:ribosomal protein S18 acetylase RimI-like enzyme
MSQLAVRQATASDLDALSELFDAYRVFYQQPSDLPRARRFIEERMQREESVILLAELESASAGFTQLFPSFSSVATQRIWVLNDLFVARQARRRGVASALMAAAEDFARAQGGRRIILETTPENTSAQALYEARGWSLDGTLHYQLDFD